jgi:hypothetical protein
MVRQRSNNTWLNIITYTVALLLLIGCIGAVVACTGIKDEVDDLINPTFKIVVDNESFTADNDNLLSMPQSGQVRFTVKNGTNCKVQILPNVQSDEDFEFSVGGKTYKYSQVGELTSVFILNSNVYGDYFIINCNRQSYGLSKVLSDVYGDTVTIENGVSIKYPYLLVVTNGSGESIEIALKFSLLKSVEISGNIVF